MRRTVAQLDFYDFISSAELTADRVNAGNPTWCRSKPGNSVGPWNIRCSAKAWRSSMLGMTWSTTFKTAF